MDTAPVSSPPPVPPSFSHPTSLYPNRRWLIIPSEIVPQIDFSQVIEKHDKLRYNQDHTKTYVSYDINIFDMDHETTYVDAKTLEVKTYIVPAGIYGRPNIYDSQYPEYIQSEFNEMIKSLEWGTL
jgi:hypothetical protein